MRNHIDKILTELSGRIERITYSDEESGFTIAKLKVSGQRDFVTIVGNLMAPSPGEILKMEGEWANHPKFGEQFKIIKYQTTVPATVYGIQKYLGSGLIKGIGPVMAKRIVKKFGKKALKIIENETEKLAEVEGIGSKRIGMIKVAWDEQKEIRDVMLFLQTHGVSSGYATKIFKKYGKKSIAIVKTNPYRLATDISGIGFVIADNIAQKLGFSKNSDFRCQAGILYILSQLSDDGHAYYPYEPLIKKSIEILQVESEIIKKALASLSEHIEKKIIIEDLNETIEDFRENNKAVYLSIFHACETGIAKRLKKLKTSKKSIRDINPVNALELVQHQLSIKLADKQVDAVKCAIGNKVMVVTGGPGTGKTTIINSILKIFARLKIRIMLAAPTGRAAKKMSETTGFEAKTIHRLLEYSFEKGGFLHNDDNPLNCDILIIDEVSMIDTVLMHHLLKSLPKSSTLILVGDVNQLPSVGTGNVLKDIITSGSVPVVELNEIFRQAKESRIIINAHKINNGIIPSFDLPQNESGDPDTDFYFIQREDPEKALDTILELVTKRIPRRFGFDPVNDIQVLTPMHKGLIGTGSLNNSLQNALNPDQGGTGEEELIRGEKKYRVNDKVMQIKNNYDKNVFNGDIGQISGISIEDNEVVINFDGRNIRYDFTDLDEIVHAYAISIHKSQGSEYPAVVIPIMTQHFILLQRNLIYTGVTRGKELVVIVGTYKAMAIGIKNDKTQKRYTHLAYRLS